METTSERLVAQADELIDRLMEERARWRYYPVMDARLKKLIRLAERRLARRRLMQEAA